MMKQYVFFAVLLTLSLGSTATVPFARADEALSCRSNFISIQAHVVSDVELANVVVAFLFNGGPGTRPTAVIRNRVLLADRNFHPVKYIGWNRFGIVDRFGNRSAFLLPGALRPGQFRTVFRVAASDTSPHGEYSLDCTIQ